jgi:hypoxia up-regulated 1
MSIDLGSEFMKIGIVKPGIPMEIVLNKESRRKTILAVSVKSNEREFGEMALSRGIKSPKSAYLYLTQILAKSLDSPAVKSYRERYPYYDIRENPETKTIYFQHDENTRFTPEELLAMILDYARDLAADFGEQAVDAAVIAVPAYFNQAERKAVLRAAEIANLKVLQLINTNAAAGLNYGVFRRKDFNSTGTTLMFFDVGGSGTTATVATFQLVKNKDDYEANPQLTIRGVGFDRTISGQAFTQRLAKHLAKKFLEQSKKDVFKSPKAILKLYKEAERVKNILSANADTMAQIEGLMDEVDFKTKVTREEFEKMGQDLFEGVQGVVDRALKSAETSLDEISQVILAGAGTRIPRIQAELLKAVKK